ncbi:hypothetical protein MP638_004474 [Amoeboaphelidium occidentale]|nr:hypothetical protein MP638_004474 [Amoeboaphelidium occidentale]
MAGTFQDIIITQESIEDTNGLEHESTSSFASNTLQVKFNRGRRTSVSAESFRPTEDTSDKIFNPKSDEIKMRIASATSNNLLFRNLEPDQKREVVDAMFERAVKKDELIIKQGDEGDNFYVVDSGLFQVSINDKKVVEIGPGGSFGELALMYNTKRAATITALSDGVLWAVDRVTFRRVVTNSSFRKRKMYECFLKSVPILSALEPNEISKIADALEPVEFDEGDVIIEQGQPGDSFYIMVEGDAIVTKKDSEDGDAVEVMKLGSGNYFGELALLTDKPRAATVTATSPSKCVCLDTKAFIRLLGPCMDILKRNAAAYETFASKA